MKRVARLESHPKGLFEGPVSKDAIVREKLARTQFESVWGKVVSDRVL